MPAAPIAVTFKQGEDKEIKVAVVENGLAVPLTGCINIKGILKVNNVIQKKYALVPETDFGSLVVDGVNTNQANIFVERAESVNFPVGAITIILLAAFPDVSFPDGERVEEFKFAVGRVTPGEGINEII